jgi:hypothetical protein
VQSGRDLPALLQLLLVYMLLLSILLGDFSTFVARVGGIKFSDHNNGPFHAAFHQNEIFITLRYIMIVCERGNVFGLRLFGSLRSIRLLFCYVSLHYEGH